MSQGRCDDEVVRVVVADDHPVVRSGLVGILARTPGIEVVGEAADGAAAVQLARQMRPDVVLMDLRMPGMDGAAATAEITAGVAGTHVLVLTTYDTDADILRAVTAGATGYLLKDAEVGDLVDAIRAAACGQTVLAAPVAGALMGRLRTPGEQLTAREVEVLAAVARGRSNVEIAGELFITEATVKTHLVHIFTKLAVDDRTHAVTEAMRRGILPGI